MLSTPRFHFGVAITALLISACGSINREPICEAGSLTMVVHADERLNLDQEQKALPTTFQLYQLKDPASLEQIEFQELWKGNAKELIGEDLLRGDRYSIYPGEEVAFDFQQEDGAVYVAAVALFRKAAGDQWRSVFRLPYRPQCRRPKEPRNNDITLHVYLSDYEIMVKEGAPVSAPKLASPPSSGRKNMNTDEKMISKDTLTESSDKLGKVPAP